MNNFLVYLCTFLVSFALGFASFILGFRIGRKKQNDEDIAEISKLRENNAKQKNIINSIWKDNKDVVVVNILKNNFTTNDFSVDYFYNGEVKQIHSRECGIFDTFKILENTKESIVIKFYFSDQEIAGFDECWYALIRKRNGSVFDITKVYKEKTDFES